MIDLKEFKTVASNIRKRALHGEAEDFWMARTGKELTALYLAKSKDKYQNLSREDLDFMVDCARNLALRGKA